MKERLIGTYQIIPGRHGEGTWFFTDCGHTMFSFRDHTAYHGKLCPGCFWKGITRSLYIRGSKEANTYFAEHPEAMTIIRVDPKKEG